MKRLILHNLCLAMSSCFLLCSTVHAQFAGGDGSAENPYLIESPEQLYAINDHLDRHFELISVIDLTSTGTQGEQYWHDGKGWKPVGSADSMFSGSFNGKGYDINGLTIQREDENYIGLFGYIQDGIVSNLTLRNTAISGNRHTGGLAGWSENAIIDNIKVYGTVSGTSFSSGGLVGRSNSDSITNSSTSGTISGASGTGGLAGILSSGTIERCFSSANVSGANITGGLVGYSNNGDIIQSYATGHVTGDTTIGGLIGGDDHGVIRECFATGNVTGSVETGGLAGHSHGLILYSYAIGDVSGIKDIGGLTGRISGDFHSPNYGKIEESYAIGKVSGSENTGGLLGRASGGTSVSAYWNTATSSQSESAGGEGRQTPQMTLPFEDTYTNWDFDAIWKVDEALNGGYPYLKWQDTLVISSSTVQTEKKTPELIIYPNPASSTLTIHGTIPANSSATFIDMQGEKKLQQTISLSGRLMLESLPEGMYIILLHSKEGKPLIKETILLK